MNVYVFMEFLCNYKNCVILIDRKLLLKIVFVKKTVHLMEKYSKFHIIIKLCYYLYILIFIYLFILYLTFTIDVFF